MFILALFLIHLFVSGGVIHINAQPAATVAQPANFSVRLTDARGRLLYDSPDNDFPANTPILFDMPCVQGGRLLTITINGRVSKTPLNC